MRARAYILFIFVVCLPQLLRAQENDPLVFKQDSVQLVDASTLPTDTLPHVDWRPDPLRAVWLGAICTGLGQIYNRSYWKLPIVYGALMGCGYAIMTNQRSYSEYKQAYVDIYTDIQNGTVDETDMTRTYNAILPNGYTISRMGGAESYKSKLQGWQNNYRRYRDISIVATVAVFALTLVDAYVDAQLFDFDISPDLSMQVEPDLFIDPKSNRAGGEVHLAIKF